MGPEALDGLAVPWSRCLPVLPLCSLTLRPNDAFPDNELPRSAEESTTRSQTTCFQGQLKSHEKLEIPFESGGVAEVLEVCGNLVYVMVAVLPSCSLHVW